MAWAEPGVRIRTEEWTVLGTVGAAWLSYPSPTASPTWLVTANALLQYASDPFFGDRFGWVSFSFVRRPFDAPDVSDVAILNRAQLHMGGRLPIARVGAIQTASRLFYDYLERPFPSGRRNVSRGGWSTSLHFLAADVVTVGITYTLTSEDDDLRQKSFFSGGNTRALARNVVMLSIYAPLFGFGISSLSARATEWGPPSTLHPVVPEFWWP